MRARCSLMGPALPAQHHTARTPELAGPPVVPRQKIVSGVARMKPVIILGWHKNHYYINIKHVFEYKKQGYIEAKFTLSKCKNVVQYIYIFIFIPFLCVELR